MEVAPNSVPTNVFASRWPVSASVTVPTIVPVFDVRDPKSTVIRAPQKIVISFVAE